MGFADDASVDDRPAGMIRYAGAGGIGIFFAKVREHIYGEYGVSDCYQEDIYD
jgi:hypothetical protein